MTHVKPFCINMWVILSHKICIDRTFCPPGKNSQKIIIDQKINIYIYVINKKTMSTNLRKAKKHMRRATDILNQNEFGFGVTKLTKELYKKEAIIKKMPKSMQCPLTLVPMVDPVVAPSGHSYEREEIETYVRKTQKCPLTREPLGLHQLYPNRQLRQAIEEYCAPLGFQPPDIVYLNETEKLWHGWCENKDIDPLKNALEMQLGEVGDTLCMDNLAKGRSYYVKTKNYDTAPRITLEGCITCNHLECLHNDESFEIIVKGIGLRGHETILFTFTYNIPLAANVLHRDQNKGWSMTSSTLKYIYSFEVGCSKEQLTDQRQKKRYSPY